METKTEIKKLGLIGSFAIYIPAAILMLCLTKYLIPYLSNETRQEAAFGWQLVITLLPLIFVQSYTVQRTKNSWVGVIMRGGLNGPSFIAICFGLI